MGLSLCISWKIGAYSKIGAYDGLPYKKRRTRLFSSKYSTSYCVYLSSCNISALIGSFVGPASEQPEI